MLAPAETVEAEARRRFPWAYPPHSDREDAYQRAQNEKRIAAGKKPKAPRDWEITRQFAYEQIRRERASP